MAERIIRLSLALALAGAVLAPVAASGAGEVRNCDNNAVVYCGAYTTTELTNKIATGDGHNQGQELQQVLYNEGRGITWAGIISGDTVSGVVTKDGRVIIDGRVIATGAQSSGRIDMPGSYRDGSLFTRPTSVAFQQDSLEAFVHRTNGRFDWAILKACGNPVKATPVAAAAVATPVPVPPPAAPLPTTGSGAGWLGLAAIMLAVHYYLASRRRLLAAFRP